MKTAKMIFASSLSVAWFVLLDKLSYGAGLTSLWMALLNIIVTAYCVIGLIVYIAEIIKDFEEHWKE